MPIKVLKTHFVRSSTRLQDCPPANMAEVAFLGRSNVGKSTFINQLLECKIAKSSTTPGKTKTANFFTTTWQLEQEVVKFGCVDLPGFGYAKVSKSLKQEWGGFLYTLLKQRVSIKLFLHLIDSRHPNLEIDAALQQFLKSVIKPDQQIMCVYTKFDKLNSHDQHALYYKTPHLLVSTLKIATLPPKFGSLKGIQQRVIHALLGL
ncbi:ribosome biogenesis GTP-binding protein YihA/YsxC [Helicobacter suis]|nr:ribosome biogenesis GTP-binding protein YihA/YsxC [Helicobacter suis]BCD46135.1 Ribosome biogenesis GTP-binding protein YsxC [Helicobacter suis]BCD47941.1 Ribosome biogenesis GTP-binding protein YsxC [Helicobacter suis]BCD49699.1 Ribosome biogenesis GTP-binding protein YsxC [Helicobacter suis]BCD51102.1 Ribosome biogenesis GTP-binding protein YsxC [Helicobacter suis]BCD70327.1 Ribosome biogenesis GTP-binding protein YsxC [Helicobacter suis]